MKVRLGIGAGASRHDPDTASLVDGCEVRGIDSLWFPDRIAAPTPEPLVALGWAAGRTRSLTLGTGVVVLPGATPRSSPRSWPRSPRSPRGASCRCSACGPPAPPERTAYPVAGPRAEVFEEALTVVRRLLTEESVTFHGRFTTLEDAVVAPRPARPLDLWLGGLVPAALRRVGASATGGSRRSSPLPKPARPAR